ncbi:MAG: hypothetical protein ACFFCZ_10295 [Promethearchaeota archaeon]
MSILPNPKTIHKELISLQEQLFDLFTLLGELQLRTDLLENSMLIPTRRNFPIEQAFASKDQKSDFSRLESSISSRYQKTRKTTLNRDKELMKAFAVIESV